MIHLIRPVVVFTVATLLLSCAGSPNQEEKASSPTSETSAQRNKYVGRWEVMVESQTVSLDLRENQKCVFSIPSGTAKGTWTVSGSNLTVEIPDTDSMGGETFYGIFHSQNDELEFWEGSSEHINLKRVVKSP